MKLVVRHSVAPVVTSGEVLESRFLLTTLEASGFGAVASFRVPEMIPLRLERSGTALMATDAALGDLDGDEIAELVISVGKAPAAVDQGDILQVFRRQAGSWSPADTVSTAVQSWDLYDFDQDGSLEIWGFRENGKPLALDWIAESAQPLQPLEIKWHATVLAYADFNHDGSLDVVYQEDDQLWLALREDDRLGQRTFLSAWPSDIPGRPVLGGRPRVLDLDQDGDLDLFCAHCHAEGVSLFENDGTGELTARDLTLALEPNQLVDSVWLQDYDLDGFTDLIAATSSRHAGSEPKGGLHVYAQQGSMESFESILELPLPQPISNLVLADVNADQHLDLVYQLENSASAGSDQVQIALGCFDCSSDQMAVVNMPDAPAGRMLGVTGNQILFYERESALQLQSYEFAPHLMARELMLLDTQIAPSEAHFVHINNDGVPDVVSLQGQRLSFLMSDGDGRFAQLFEDVELQNATLLVDDFDGTSGSQALLVGNTDDETVLMRIRHSDTDVGQVLTETFRTDRGVIIATDDLDNDGRLDFVFRDDFVSSNRRSSVLLNRGDGWIQRTLSTESGTVAIDDLDGDGTLEAYVFENPIRIFKYQADEFVPWGEIPKGTTRAQVLDLNSDGLKDFVSVRKQGGVNIVLTPMVANGDGTWQQWGQVTVSDSVFEDINGDGLIDIVSPRHFYFSDGEGKWHVTDELPSSSPVWGESNQYLDVNGDGLVDNAKLHLATGLLELHTLNGAGQWDSVEAIPVASEWELADFNGDGLLDLLQLESGILRVTPRHGVAWGEATVVAEKVLRYFVHPLSRTPVMSVLTDGKLLTIEGNGIHNMQVTETLEVGTVQVTDINADGHADLVVVDDEVGSLRSRLEPKVSLGSPKGFGPAVALPQPQPITQWFENAMWFSPQSMTGEQESYLIATELDATQISSAFPRTVADIDADGDDDILALVDAGLLVFLGQGEGDFDGNGRADIGDIELLRDAISAGETENKTLDLNGDGEISELDVQDWVERIAKVRAGDTNLDGIVDFSDFLRLSLNFGKSTNKWSEGDFDGDGRASFTDFLLLSSFFENRRLVDEG